MAKGMIRSIRFSDELYELIDRQNGDTFTQKLENLVTRCVWELPAKEKELAAIQERIKQEREDFSRIQALRRSMEQKCYYLDALLRRTLEEVKRYEEQITKLNEEL